MKFTKIAAPIFIMLAASLWAIDALFRTQLTYTIPPASIVFFEHLIGFIFLSPIFLKNLNMFKTLTTKDWINFIALTIISSTLGTVLFTQALKNSFTVGDFVTPLLMLKLQPIFVVALSGYFLREKLTRRFLVLAFFAVIGSYMITFGTMLPKLSLSGKELVYLLSLGATFSWGGGTILSKNALKKLNFPEATALRFLLAVPIALLFAFALGQTFNFLTLTFDQLWRFLVIASITGGAFSLILYYRGLKYTEAKVSTISELIFPIIAILIAITSLNPYGQPQVLTLANVLGIGILLTSIILISSDYERKRR